MSMQKAPISELRSLLEETDRQIESLAETLQALDAQLAPYRRARDMVRAEVIATHETEVGPVGLAVRRWVRTDRRGLFARMDRLAEVWGPTLTRRKDAARDLAAARRAAERMHEVCAKRTALENARRQQELFA